MAVLSFGFTTTGTPAGPIKMGQGLAESLGWSDLRSASDISVFVVP